MRISSLFPTLILCTLGTFALMPVAQADFGNQMQTGIQEQHSGISSYNSGIGGTRQAPAGYMEHYQNGYSNTTGPINDTTGPQQYTTQPMNDTTGPSQELREMPDSGPAGYRRGTMQRRIVIPQQSQ